VPKGIDGENQPTKESVVTDRRTDREVIVTNNDGRSSGALVAGIVAVLVILLAIWFFANNDVGGDDGTIGGTVDVNVSVPATSN
jgi:hypothetical protein